MQLWILRGGSGPNHPHKPPLSSFVLYLGSDMGSFGVL